MRRRAAVLAAGAATGVLALALAGCGSGSSSTTKSSSSSSSSSSGGGMGGTVKVVEGTFPDYLDVSEGYTTQAQEATAMVYTPLLTYAAKTGTAGDTVIPGLAQALPTISSDGLTYTLQLRSGLKYSDGTAVKASDFKFAVKRAIKLQWGGDSFLTGYIKGAADYAANKAPDISGITADDASGKITITLTQPYGAFENVLAFEEVSPIPQSTPMTTQTTTFPAGVGPYKFGTVVPNRSYQLVKNPSFKSLGIPGIPTGYADTIDVSVQSNTTTEAEQVLNNQADVFDWADVVPAALLTQIQSKAASRYKQLSNAYTYYMFMDTTQKPFNNVAVRQAVNMALDRTALQRLGSGTITPGCYFLPPSIPGHPSGYSACPGGDPAKSPSKAQVAKAKAMVTQAGLAGTPVTVWSQTKSPRQQYMSYYTTVLNEIGLKATLKVIADSSYFSTVGNANTKAQTGFADWSQDFPNPSDFYLLLSKAGIQPVNNENFGNVDDPKIEQQLTTLEAVPSGQLASVAPKWQALEKYVAQQGYIADFGYGTSPQFTSDRVDQSKLVFQPVDGILFSTLSVK